MDLVTTSRGAGASSAAEIASALDPHLVPSLRKVLSKFSESAGEFSGLHFKAGMRGLCGQLKHLWRGRFMLVRRWAMKASESATSIRDSTSNFIMSLGPAHVCESQIFFRSCLVVFHLLSALMCYHVSSSTS
eukprot:758579-Hanusia_phi.AAC.2